MLQRKARRKGCIWEGRGEHNQDRDENIHVHEVETQTGANMDKLTGDGKRIVTEEKEDRRQRGGRKKMQRDHKQLMNVPLGDSLQ